MDISVNQVDIQVTHSVAQALASIFSAGFFSNKKYLPWNILQNTDLIPSLLPLFSFFGTIWGAGWKGWQVRNEGKGKVRKSGKKEIISVWIFTQKMELHFKTLVSAHRRDDILK